MKNIINALEAIGQNFSIHQFDSLDDMLESSNTNQFNFDALHSLDQMCLLLPTDDEEGESDDSDTDTEESESIRY